MPRTVVVTGSASGIGRATAQLCAERGWRVIGLDRNAGDGLADIRIDLADAAQRATLAEQVNAVSKGPIDAVIACAGTVGKLAVRVNFFGMRDSLALLRPLLVRGHAPRAVAVTSASVLFPTDPAIVAACLGGDEEQACHLAENNPRQSYPSSKLAMQHWLCRQAIHADWGGQGILLNAVAPGTVETPLVQPVLATEQGRAWLQEAVPTVLGRNAAPAELAEALVWLASAENSYMVGQHLFIDGGSQRLLSDHNI